MPFELAERTLINGYDSRLLVLNGLLDVVSKGFLVGCARIQIEKDPIFLQSLTVAFNNVCFPIARITRQVHSPPILNCLHQALIQLRTDV